MNAIKVYKCVLQNYILPLQIFCAKKKTNCSSTDAGPIQWLIRKYRWDWSKLITYGITLGNRCPGAIPGEGPYNLTDPKSLSFAMFSLTIEMKTGSNWNNGNIGERNRMEWLMRCDPVYLNSIDLDLNLSLKSMTGLRETSPLSIGNWKWFITLQTESPPGIVAGKLRKNLPHFLA